MRSIVLWKFIFYTFSKLLEFSREVCVNVAAHGRDPAPIDVLGAPAINDL